MKLVVNSFGQAVLVLAVLMAITGAFAIYADGAGASMAFLLSALMSAFFGGGLMLSTASRRRDLNKQESYFLLFLYWLGLPPLAALPFWLGPWSLPAEQALFEAVSALTTTGFTVLTEQDGMARSLLLWRALLQWAGGLMTVVLMVVLLVSLRVGGLQLFRNAMPHGEGGGSIPDRLLATARDLLPVYAGFTAVCAICLWIAGMSGFDALCTALATLSTGGFVTAGASAEMARPLVQFVLVVFMIVAAVNLTSLWALVHRRPRPFRRDPEARYLAWTMAILACLLFALLLSVSDAGLVSAFRQAVFLTVSGMTTTAFLDPTAKDWPLISPVLVIGLLFVGASTASTSGGMRLLRIAVLFKQARRELYRLNHPHGVLPMRIGEQRIDDRAIWGVWSYFFALVTFTALVAMALAGLGLGPTGAIAAAVVALTNAGPFAAILSSEFGLVADLPVACRAVLILAMLAARLELLTLLIVFYPSYWRR